MKGGRNSSPHKNCRYYSGRRPNAVPRFKTPKKASLKPACACRNPLAVQITFSSSFFSLFSPGLFFLYFLRVTVSPLPLSSDVHKTGLLLRALYLDESGATDETYHPSNYTNSPFFDYIFITVFRQNLFIELLIVYRFVGALSAFLSRYFVRAPCFLLDLAGMYL